MGSDKRDPSDLPTPDERALATLNNIAAVGKAAFQIHDAPGEWLHLMATNVAETPYVRIFETRVYAEPATEVERVIVQTRSDPNDEWGTPKLHFRDEDGLTDGVSVILR